MRPGRARWLRRGLAAVAVSSFGCAGNVAQAGLGTSSFADLAFTQHPGARLPGDAALKDESGRGVRLAALFDGRPLILVLDYLRCPNLCGLVLGGLLEGLGKSSIKAEDYRVLAISIDPKESASDAAASRAAYGDRFGSAALGAWTFLTGDESEVRRVAAAIGFPYRYDAAIGQYAHPAGAVVATPDGIVSRYLLGVDYEAQGLRLALAGAKAGSVAAPASPLLLLCYDYDPASGSYTPSVMKLLRWGGILTVLAGGGLLGLQLRREARGR